MDMVDILNIGLLHKYKKDRAHLNVKVVAIDPLGNSLLYVAGNEVSGDAAHLVNMFAVDVRVVLLQVVGKRRLLVNIAETLHKVHHLPHALQGAFPAKCVFDIGAVCLVYRVKDSEYQFVLLLEIDVEGLFGHSQFAAQVVNGHAADAVLLESLTG